MLIWHREERELPWRGFYEPDKDRSNILIFSQELEIRSSDILGQFFGETCFQ